MRNDMRMARVKITMPDELYAEAKGAGLNISRLVQDAVRAELARLGGAQLLRGLAGQ